mgnify:CR=1 FL=1
MKFQLFETGSIVINRHRGRLGIVVDKNPGTPWIDILWFDTAEVECEPKSILQILEQPNE